MSVNSEPKGSITRAPKDSQNPYVMISRSLFEDDAISWKAKGLMGYLLSRKDGWKIWVADLQKRSTDGRDACYAALDELGRAGYLTRSQVRDKGRMVRVNYQIYELPDAGRAADWQTVSGKAVSGKAVSGKAVSGKAVSGKSPTSNKSLQSITEAKKEVAEGGQPEQAQGQALGEAAAATFVEFEETEGGQDQEMKAGRYGFSPYPDPQEVQTVDTTAPRDIPPAELTARAALGKCFKTPAFLETLLSEFVDRQAWLALPPGFIQAALDAARAEYGDKYSTQLIKALDAEVQRRKPKKTAQRAAPAPVDILAELNSL